MMGTFSLLLYFEKGCEKPLLYEAAREKKFEFNWYNPSNGEWVKSENVKSSIRGFLQFPNFPDNNSISNKDWALKVKIVN